MNVNRKKILVADDDTDILDAMKIVLEEMGNYETVTTSQPETVFHHKNPLPDLILLDLWMSGVKGSDICRALKSDQQTQNIPVILFSASPDVREEAEESGADDYTTKPFQIQDLLKKINDLVR